jgi:hypothetical protein
MLLSSIRQKAVPLRKNERNPDLRRHLIAGSINDGDPGCYVPR